MKLATYNDGSRDGQLVVVSRDLATAHYASGVAQRLHQVLDDWNFLGPQLQDLYETLNGGKARHAFPFESARCLAPLPRSTRWAIATPLAGAREAASRLHLVHQASDAFAAPCHTLDRSPAPNGEQDGNGEAGFDFGCGIAVATGDIATGAVAETALEGVRLLLLASEIRWHRAADAPLVLGHAFGPVAVTPDEAGAAWSGGRLRLHLEVVRSGKKFARIEIAECQSADFGGWLASLCALGPIRAGSLVGTGALETAGGAAEGAAGIAARRSIEIARDGSARTPFLTHGETALIEVRGLDGHSLFGAIEFSVPARLTDAVPVSADPQEA